MCFKFDSLVIDQASRTLLGYEQHSKLNHTIYIYIYIYELRIYMQDHGWNMFVVCYLFSTVVTYVAFLAVLSQKQNT